MSTCPETAAVFFCQEHPLPGLPACSSWKKLATMATWSTPVKSCSAAGKKLCLAAVRVLKNLSRSDISDPSPLIQKKRHFSIPWPESLLENWSCSTSHFKRNPTNGLGVKSMFLKNKPWMEQTSWPQWSNASTSRRNPFSSLVPSHLARSSHGRSLPQRRRRQAPRWYGTPLKSPPLTRMKPKPLWMMLSKSAGWMLYCWILHLSPSSREISVTTSTFLPSVRCHRCLIPWNAGPRWKKSASFRYSSSDGMHVHPESVPGMTNSMRWSRSSAQWTILALACSFHSSPRRLENVMCSEEPRWKTVCVVQALSTYGRLARSGSLAGHSHHPNNTWHKNHAVQFKKLWQRHVQKVLEFNIANFEFC